MSSPAESFLSNRTIPPRPTAPLPTTPPPTERRPRVRPTRGNKRSRSPSPPVNNDEVEEPRVFKKLRDSRPITFVNITPEYKSRGRSIKYLSSSPHESSPEPDTSTDWDEEEDQAHHWRRVFDKKRPSVLEDDDDDLPSFPVDLSFQLRSIRKPRNSGDSNISLNSDASSFVSTTETVRSAGGDYATFTPKALADLVLLSSDDPPIQFYVDSQTIYDASSVLRTLGSIPSEKESESDEPLTLPLFESSKTIERILRLIYPKARKPTVPSFSVLDTLLTLCTQYKLYEAINILSTTSLLSLGLRQPLKAYSLACKHDLSDGLLKLLSRETLRLDLSKVDITGEMAECTPTQIKRLIRLHSKRASSAASLILEAAASEEFTCAGAYCQDGLAEWFVEFGRRVKSETKRSPAAETVFASAFLSGCVRVAARKCEGCVESFLSGRAQLRLAVLKDEVDKLENMVQ